MSDQPRYRIRAVSEMTGVPSPTLRAWESRYGVPSPIRAESSSYRLYGEHDIEQIRRLKSYCDEGMAPADAAELVKREDEALPDLEAARPSADAEAYDQVADEIVLAARRFDPTGLEAAVRRALVLGSGRDIFEHVFRPALRRVGEDWHADDISVAQEHLVSERVDTATRMLLRLVQSETARRTALLVLFGEEVHLLPLYGAAFHFAEWGFRVTMLGRSMPPEALADAVVNLRPDIVGFSLTTAPPQRWQVEGLVRAYAGACGRTPWILGGLGAAAIEADVQAAGGAVASDDLEATRALVEQLVKGASP